MKILIVCDVYFPEISSAALLMKDLAEGFIKKGYKVSVLTSYPKYYLKDEDKGKAFDLEEDISGVNISRVKVLPHHKVNFIVRGISQLTMPFIFFFSLKKKLKKNIDAVIIYSPPLTLGIFGYLMKKFYKSRFILNLQDIFPQNAIDLGILKNKFVIKFFELIENFVYKQSDFITFNSQRGRQFLIENKGVDENKIKTVFNWIDFSKSDNKANFSFRDKWNLNNKFVFLFAGTMGPAQGLESIIEVAKKVQGQKDIIFLIVGDGSEKEKIVSLVKEYNLENVVFKPLVSKEDHDNLLKEINVGIVSLSSKNKTPFIPGKLMGYMSANKPVLALVNKESDCFDVVRDANCGYAVKSDDSDKAAEMAIELYKNKANLEKLGENGFNYAKENFSLKGALDKLEKLF